MSQQQQKGFTLIELIEEVRDQVLLQNGGESLLAPESLDTAKEPCKAKIHIELPPELMIEADYDQLFRAFSNLIRNPLDAGATEVTIKLAPANDQNKEDAFAEILIMDNGPGLPEKAIKNLFVPFAATGRKGGTGLGLAIARELILAHEGDLRLSATGPDGATFCVQLRVIM